MPLIRYLSIAEMEAILNAPDLRTRSGIRDRAMLHVGFAAGLRVSELAGLLLTGVTLQPTPTVSVIGKGRKQRSLPLCKQTAADIRAWLVVRDKSSVPELFLDACGKPMTRVGFTYLLCKHARTAARSCPSLLEKHVSPHLLRHSCAMMIFQPTGDLRKVSLWLGHATCKPPKSTCVPIQWKRYKRLKQSRRRLSGAVGSLFQTSSSPPYAGHNYYVKRSRPTTAPGSASIASTFHNDAHSIR
jgi:site-specific recombinase XerC